MSKRQKVVKDHDDANGDDGKKTSTFAVKVGLAQMLKGGVIMDVINVAEARIAEEAGACAVMALERVPSDIRRDGGVARSNIFVYFILFYFILFIYVFMYLCIYLYSANANAKHK